MFDENRFKKFHDQRLIGQKLISMKERSEQVYLWRFVGEKKLLAPVVIDFVKRSRSEFKVSPAPGHEQLYAQVVGDGSVLNFFFPQSSLLFQSRAKGHDSESLLAAFPGFFAQVERRKSLRLACEGKPTQVGFTKAVTSPRPGRQQFHKGLTDLSDGGMAIVLTRVEAKFFTPGEVIKDIQLKLDESRMTVSAQVVRVQEMVPNGIEDVAYRSWKLTLRFVELEAKQKQDIIKFVFEHLSLTSQAI